MDESCMEIQPTDFKGAKIEETILDESADGDEDFILPSQPLFPVSATSHQTAPSPPDTQSYSCTTVDDNSIIADETVLDAPPCSEDLFVGQPQLYNNFVDNAICSTPEGTANKILSTVPETPCPNNEAVVPLQNELLRHISEFPATPSLSSVLNPSLSDTVPADSQMAAQHLPNNLFPSKLDDTQNADVESILLESDDDQKSVVPVVELDESTNVKEELKDNDIIYKEKDSIEVIEIDPNPSADASSNDIPVKSDINDDAISQTNTNNPADDSIIKIESDSNYDVATSKQNFKKPGDLIPERVPETETPADNGASLQLNEVSHGDKAEPDDADTDEATPIQPEQNIAKMIFNFSLDIQAAVHVCKETNTITHKEIIKARERHATFDSTSESIRESMSSAGSVYSDKTGLPFAIRPRFSIGTSSSHSGSTTDDQNFLKPQISIQELQPWKNDCLILFTCDKLLMQRLKIHIKNSFSSGEYNAIGLKRDLRASSKDSFNLSSRDESVEESAKAVKQKEIDNIEKRPLTSPSAVDMSPETVVLSSDGIKASTPKRRKPRIRPPKDIDDVRAKRKIKNPTSSRLRGRKRGKDVTDNEVLSPTKKRPLNSDAESTSVKKLKSKNETTPTASPSKKKKVGQSSESKSSSSRFETPKKELTANLNVTQTSGKFPVGTYVFARWDRFYYSGILGDEVSGKFSVQFDDGTNKEVPEKFLILQSSVQKGLGVQVLKGNRYINGVVTSVLSDCRYEVEVSDTKEKVDASNLRFHEDQLKRFYDEKISIIGSPASTSRGYADIDLGNIISGKRRVMSTPTSSSFETSMKIPETLRLEYTCGLEIDELLGSSDTKNQITVTGRSVKSRRNILKDVSQDKSRELGPIPNETSAIFQSMSFLFCYVKPVRQKPPKKSKSKSTSQSELSLSESEDADYYEKQGRIPFDASHLKRQIEAGKGKVYDFFEDIPPAEYASTRLVTNKPNRSARFLLCLTHGIEVVLHLHIIQACRGEDINRMKLQHSGWSPMKRCWLERPLYIQRTFDNKRIYLYSKSEDSEADRLFIKFWSLTIRKGGGIAISENDLNSAEVIVADTPLPSSLDETLRELGDIGPSVVSTSWLYYSLIHGTSLSPRAHASFRPDYQSSD